MRKTLRWEAQVGAPDRDGPQTEHFIEVGVRLRQLSDRRYPIPNRFRNETLETATGTPRMGGMDV